MPAGAFGTVHAPLGLYFPPLPRRAPFRSLLEAADGYAAPKAPAGQSYSDDELFP